MPGSRLSSPSGDGRVEPIRLLHASPNTGHSTPLSAQNFVRDAKGGSWPTTAGGMPFSKVG
jgi:hypothetical protein